MKEKPLRLDCVNNIRKEKESLLRIVLTPSGTVEVDPTGKMNGRGAYLTPDTQTLEKAIKTKRLEKTLGVVIDEKVYQKIRRYLVD